MLEWSPFVGLGAFSYSLYLTHVPVMQVMYVVLSAVLSEKMTAIVMILATPPICVFIAYRFYLWFEKPEAINRLMQVFGAVFTRRDQAKKNDREGSMNRSLLDSIA
jgi:peptidoglycan/LPS O-acetylase OafA/YrhL